MFTFAFFTVSMLLLGVQQTHAALNANLTAENTLMIALLSGYRRDIRPDDVVVVKLTISLKQILSLDEKNQIMTSSLYFSQRWNDPRLTWTPSARQDIEVVMMSTRNIWVPDTYILNSADTDGYLELNSDFTYAAVQYTGDVYLVIPSTGIKTRCSLFMQNYPFDTQECQMKMTSWANPNNRFQLDVTPDESVDLSEYTASPIWELTSTDVYETTGTDRDPFEDTVNPEVGIKFKLKRKPLYYMMNSIFPCLILNVAALLTFYMPYVNGIMMCMQGFLVFSVYSLRISNDIPVQSDFMPKITIYFIISISINLLIMVWYLWKGHYSTHIDNLPKFIESFAKMMVKVFCWCYPPDKKTAPTEKDEKPKTSESTVEDASVAKAAESKKEEKPKCKFCDRCEPCEKDFEKDKAKGKRKKEVEKYLEALNYLVLIIALALMFVFQMSVWLSYSS